MKTTVLYCSLVLFFAATSAFSQWVNTDGFNGISVTAISAAGTDIVAGTQYDGVFRTTNGGANWSAVSIGLPDSMVVYCFAVSGSTLYAGKGKQIFTSTNNGANWSGASSGLSFVQQIYTIISHSSFLFTGTTNGLFRSGNNGASWDSITSNLPSNTQISCFASNGTTLLAGTSGGSVFKSINNGANWTSANSGLSTMSVYTFAVSDAKIFAGTQDGIFVSTNNGDNWEPMNTGLTGSLISRSFALSGQDIFAAVGGLVYLSKNGTAQWMQVHTGMLAQNVIALEKNGGDLFAANFSGGIWRRPLSEMITSSADRSTAPYVFALEQNYPNPFNPTTMIGFTLKESGMTTLEIYDVVGREAAVLVKDHLEVGVYHQRIFDASRFPSGIYFARLTNGGKSRMKKLLLIK